jgi:hypothetical protein
VTAVAAGHAPASKVVQVPAGGQAQLRLELVPIGGKLAHLQVHSPVPDAEVLVDGQVQGRTPLPGSLSVTPGRHEVRMRRAGYREARRDVAVDEGATAELELDADEAPQSGAWGRVHLALSEPDADVSVNGRRRPDFRAGLKLPEGAHRLEVKRAGFFTLERDITVSADREITVPLTLDATEETRTDHARRASGQRARGWITLGAGAVVAAGGAAVYFANRSALDGAQAEHDEVAAMLRPGGACYVDFDVAACAARTSHANDRLSRAEGWRWVGPAVAGVGLAAAVTGAVLLLIADDPHKYDAGHVDLAWRPVIGPGSVGVSTTF